MSITLNDFGPAHDAGTTNSGGYSDPAHETANLHSSAGGADYGSPAREGSPLNAGSTSYGGPAPHHTSSPSPGAAAGPQSYGTADPNGREPGPESGADSGGPGSHGDGIRGSAPIFAALGDKTRLALVARLCSGGPLSIARLTAGADITRQAITKHLNILAGAGLVRDIRVGRERLWEIETRQIEAARRALERISAQWDDALARLKLAVESDEH